MINYKPCFILDSHTKISKVQPDRSRQGLGGENSQTHQGRDGNLLSGRTARPHIHASGSGQRRPAGLPEVLDAAVGPRQAH